MILKVDVLCCFLFSYLSLSWAACNNTMVTKKVFFDVSIGNDYWGRVLIGLFGDTTPITSLNFATFASNYKDIGYRGTLINRVYPNMAIQGGDIVHNNGTGSMSIFNDREAYFPDENYIFSNLKGWIGMTNRGPGTNTNGCQFYINTNDNQFLDGKYVAFGKVLTGFDVVMKVANLPLNDLGFPNISVTIVGSGTFLPNRPYAVAYNMPYYY